jgi:AICAR transformylase/IMP cyclohydrolase PurH
MKTAFISVSNKEGLVDVARVLIHLDTRLIASKGTAEFLRKLFGSFPIKGALTVQQQSTLTRVL